MPSRLKKLAQKLLHKKRMGTNMSAGINVVGGTKIAPMPIAGRFDTKIKGEDYV